MKNILTVNDLCKTYIINKTQNNVLRNVNFNLKKGEMAAIMGPSGSGKSTLLYTVSGMDTITAGNVQLNEKEISNMPEQKLSQVRLEEMGFVFQKMNMLKNLSILDNILLPAFQSKKNKNRKTEKIEYAKQLMRKLGIIDIADNDITEVSGGQLQRACICRSMINCPEVIFADEPTGALNRTSSNEVMEELIKINKEGTAVMLVTHDVKVAAKCTRIMYIVDGNIKGEYDLGKLDEMHYIKDRERTLNNWLIEMGW